MTMSSNEDALKKKFSAAQALAEAERLGIVKIGPTGIGKTRAFIVMHPDGTVEIPQNVTSSHSFSTAASPNSSLLPHYSSLSRGNALTPRDGENGAPADYIELSAPPELLTSASISQLLAKDTSSKEKAVKYLIKFCQMRISVHQFILELYDKGTDEEVRDYFKRNADAVLILPMDVFRRENKKIRGATLEEYKNILALLEMNQVDKAYIMLYPGYLNSKRGFESIKNSAANYMLRQKTSEYLYFQEIIRTLKPYTTYAEKCVRHTIYRVIKSTNGVMRATDLSKYFNETTKKFAEYDAIINDLFGAKSPFPPKYISEQAPKSKAICAELERCKKLTDNMSKSGFVESEKIESDFYPSLYKLECHYRSLVEKYQSEHAELTKLMSKMEMFDKELKSFFDEFPKKINILLRDFFNLKFENIPNLTERQLAYKALVIKEAEVFQQEYAKVYNERIGNLYANFNGDNLVELSEAVADFPIHVADLLAREKLFLEHIADMLNKFKEKLENVDKKIKNDTVKIAEENAALKAECQTRYQAKLQTYQANVAKSKKEKDDLKAQIKERKRQEVLLQQQNQAREEKERVEKAMALTRKILDTKLSKEQEMLFDQIFSDNPPHYKVPYDDIKKLIIDLGGKVISQGGSHQKMQINIISLGDDLCMIDDETESDNEMTNIDASAIPAGSAAAGATASATAAIATSNTSAEHSGILVKPHKAGHNPGLLPQYALKQIRALLERVGLKWQPKTSHKERPKK